MLARIQAFHIGLFGEFLAKLDAIPDGDGSLLDNSMLLYGSNMSNSNAHDHYPLPNVLVGGGRGRLKGGQHIVRRRPRADDEPAAHDARQGRRRRRIARRQHRHDQRAARREHEPKLTRSLPAAALLARRRVAADGRDAAPRASREERRSRDGARRSRATPPRSRAAEADGTTALHWAVRQNDLELVDRLLRTGADVNAANRYGVTPLQPRRDQRRRRSCSSGCSTPAATRTPSARTARLLLMTVARGGHVDAARLLLERGAEVDARETWHGQTALMWAAAQGHPGDAARAARARRRRERALERRRVGAPGHVRAARQVAAAGRTHAAVVRGARELPRVPAGADRSRRRRQRHDAGRHQRRSSSRSSTATTTSPARSSRPAPTRISPTTRAARRSTRPSTSTRW